MDDFIRDSVTLAAPHTPYAAKLLLSHTARYVLWCKGQGWPLEANVIWSVRGIDIYSTTANQECSEGTRRNYRTFLLRISEVLMPEEHPERQTPLSTRTTVAPYTEREMDSFREWAGAQLTDLKRDRAMLMLTLCAGAGLRPGELPFVHYDDVIVDDQGVLIMVDGREVPLQASIYNYLLHDQGVLQEQLLVNYRSNTTLLELGKLAGYPNALRAERPDLRIQYRDDVSLEDVRIELGLSEDLVAVADPERVAVAVTYLEGVSGQWNDFEAMTTADLVRWYHDTLVLGLSSTHTAPMTDEYFWTEAIGVVSLHRAQRSRVIELLRAAFMTLTSDPRLPGWIESAVDTVERFQGQERDIILATYAVGDPDTVAEEEDFLHNLNRFNVLATRARAKLIVMASREIIQHTSNDLETIRTSEMLKDFVDVFCSNELLVQLPSPLGDVSVELRWRT
ncbi:AAA domain-containing protein [Microbacterium oxydans]|nr:AAA domain-containing protein [Microbacterium oxydans]